jgi:Fe-S cluster assembly protein SufD
MNQATHIEPDWVARNFIAFERSLNGEAQSPLHAIRTDAFAHFCRMGFPTPQHEEWKYTNVAPIARSAFSLTRPGAAPVPVPSDLATHLNRDISAHNYVFLDGTFSAELSSIAGLPAGVTVHSLASLNKPRSELLLRHVSIRLWH